MKRFAAAAAILAGTALATPALAQDAPFEGFRVEGIVGYDSVRAGDDDGDDQSLDSLAYGVGIGYDFNLGGAVVGIEAELSDSGGEEEFDDTIDNIAYLGTLTLGRDVYVGGRIGVPVTPSTLIYAKAGYTNATLEASYASTASSLNFDASLDGYRLGLGLEQAFGRNAYAKVEYRYSNYSGLRFDDTVFGDDQIDIDLDRHQAVVGFGFRF